MACCVARCVTKSRMADAARAAAARGSGGGKSPPASIIVIGREARQGVMGGLRHRAAAQKAKDDMPDWGKVQLGLNLGSELSQELLFVLAGRTWLRERIKIIAAGFETVFL